MGVMVAAHLRVAPLGSAAAVDPSGLRDLIYAEVTPESRVEHIRVRAGPYSADILAFVDTDDLKEANDTLQRVVNQAIASTPSLHGWRII
jgi:hypothetical protein